MVPPCVGAKPPCCNGVFTHRQHGICVAHVTAQPPRRPTSKTAGLEVIRRLLHSNSRPLQSAAADVCLAVTMDSRASQYAATFCDRYPRFRLLSCSPAVYRNQINVSQPVVAWLSPYSHQVSLPLSLHCLLSLVMHCYPVALCDRFIGELCTDRWLRGVMAILKEPAGVSRWQG